MEDDDTLSVSGTFEDTSVLNIRGGLLRQNSPLRPRLSSNGNLSERRAEKERRSLCVWGSGIFKMLTFLRGRNIVEVQSGGKHFAVLTHSGAVYTWGNNRSGQLGLGDRDERSQPVAISAGDLGVEATDDDSSPARADACSGERRKVTCIACGASQSAAALSDGSLLMWGGVPGYEGDINRPKLLHTFQHKVKQVALGPYHCGALLESGELYCWGQNVFGLLGCGEPDTNATVTEPRKILLREPESSKEVLFLSAAAGERSFAASTTSGDVYAWGCNAYHALGNESVAGGYSNVPVRVLGPLGAGANRVVEVACGSQYHVALTESGSVFSWGRSRYGALGHGDTNTVPIPRVVEFLHNNGIVVTKIRCGTFHCLALASNGQLYRWGRTQRTSLQRPEDEGSYDAIPTLVENIGDRNVVDISCGHSFDAVIADLKAPQLSREDAIELLTKIAKEDVGRRMMCMLNDFINSQCTKYEFATLHSQAREKFRSDSRKGHLFSRAKLPALQCSTYQLSFGLDEAHGSCSSSTGPSITPTRTSPAPFQSSTSPPLLRPPSVDSETSLRCGAKYCQVYEVLQERVRITNCGNAVARWSVNRFFHEDPGISEHVHLDVVPCSGVLNKGEWCDIEFQLAFISPGLLKCLIVLDVDGGMSSLFGVTAAAQPITGAVREIPFEQIADGEVLGRGGAGIVYRTELDFGGDEKMQVAVKRFINVEHMAGVHGMDQQTLDEFRRELAIMAHLQHTNIISIVGACTRFPDLCVVMPFVRCGSLFSVLQNKANDITWDLRFRVLKDIARGMQYLHKCHVIHRDLKSENLLVDGDMDDTGRVTHIHRVRVTDFSVSRSVSTSEVSTTGARGKEHWFQTVTKPQHLIAQDDATLTSKVGTQLWMAPEVLSGHEYTEKADIYSFAIVMWELLTRDLPYGEFEVFVPVEAIVMGMRPQLPPECPKWYSSMMTQCWQADPRGRPSFSAILRWIAEVEKSPGQDSSASLPGSPRGGLSPRKGASHLPSGAARTQSRLSSCETSSSGSNPTSFMSMGELGASMDVVPRLSSVEAERPVAFVFAEEDDEDEEAPSKFVVEDWCVETVNKKKKPKKRREKRGGSSEKKSLMVCLEDGNGGAVPLGRIRVASADTLRECRKLVKEGLDGVPDAFVFVDRVEGYDGDIQYIPISSKQEKDELALEFKVLTIQAK